MRHGIRRNINYIRTSAPSEYVRRVCGFRFHGLDFQPLP